MPAAASSSALLPWATIRPLPITTRSSATASTSRSRCEESRTVPARSAKSRSSLRIQKMPSGSSPFAGSSRISTRGSPSSAWAMPSRWRMPSEYLPTRFLAAESDRPTRASSSADAAPVDAHQVGAQPQHLAAGAAGVLGGGVEQHAHLAPGVREPLVVLLQDERRPGGRRREAADHPHRRRLAGPVRSQEAGHGARLAAERHVVHRDLARRSASSGLLHLDHACSIVAGTDGVHPPEVDSRGRPRSIGASTSVGGHGPARAIPLGGRWAR